jgi:CubicO group peptidase (beta-lactamase class C family)
VAGAVAEAVSGKPWAQLIDEIYVQPCGLDALGFNNHFTQFDSGFEYPDAFGADLSTLQATDNPNMEGGMYTDPDDYAALMLMHLRGGECDGGRVLSAQAVDTMHADRIGEVYDGVAGRPARVRDGLVGRPRQRPDQRPGGVRQRAVARSR